MREINYAKQVREEARPSLTITHRLMNKEFILKTVSREFGVNNHVILSQSLQYRATVPRQIAQFFAMMIPDQSPEVTGIQFGGKDRTTVLHSLKTVVSLYESLPKYRTHVDNIRDRLRISEEDFTRQLDRWRKD